MIIKNQACAGHRPAYTWFKKENDDYAESSVTTASDGTRLRHMLLQGSVELRKIWDINDSGAEGIHSKVGEVIAVDCQLISTMTTRDLNH